MTSIPNGTTPLSRGSCQIRSAYCSERPKGTPELETTLKGIFEKRRFLDLLRDFIVFGEVETKDGQSQTVKILAGLSPVSCGAHAVAKHRRRDAPERRPRIGVIWHTQGSGKSLLMAFYAGQDHQASRARQPHAGHADGPQRSGRSAARHIQHVQGAAATDAGSRQNSATKLRELLDRPSGGVIFTTIQKFSPEEGERDFPLLTDRRNVVVIADEAHRSQYGFKAKVAAKTGEISYGFAKYLRDALPNASFIGFTGTPIEADDVNTPAVFGEYIDIYDISRAVEDGATVPIYYESRSGAGRTSRGRKAEDRRRNRRADRRPWRDRRGAPQQKLSSRRGRGWR